ncbi:MAG: alanine/glycine:cation symporter family protein [Gemmiger sp.]|nr:alanine/glycine:cation symporter family protein [Gemmiger sp.]
MVEWITNANRAINGFVWGPAGLLLLFGAGLWFTVQSKAFQFTHCGYWLQKTIGAIFTNRQVTAPTGPQAGSISQFQSLCTALAATIGTGNIVGVATAIVNGGPGAIFWMWLMSLLGMMTSFAENVLGIYYRRKNQAGEWVGGPMYYLHDGLGAKKGCRGLGRALARLFSCFCVLASFGIGNMGQVNAISGNVQAAFGLPTWVTGLALMLLCAPVILGGVKQVAAVSEKLVPVMSLFYMAGTLLVIFANLARLPAALGAIFEGAFGLQALGGGLLGYGVKNAIGWGFKRGAFSNEAGLGSSVMIHASANVREPVQQGMWGIFVVFADTIVGCSLTALAVLTSGVVELSTGRAVAGVSGVALVGQAFSSVFGGLGPKFIALSILLFAYSTVLGWSHYGAKAFEYLFGTRATGGYRAVFIALVFVGATIPLDLAWDLSDTFNGLMMLPNLVGVLALSGRVRKITQNYHARYFLHQTEITPLCAFSPRYQAEAAAGYRQEVRENATQRHARNATLG